MSFAKPAAIAVNGASFRVGIAASRFNADLVDALLERVVQELRSAGVKEKAITIVRVPGAHEVPWAAGELARGGRRDVIVGLGVLIGGDTSHHEMVGESVSHALQSVALATRTPVINGVIVANNRAQAVARTTGRIDRGVEFAEAALEMAALRKKISR